MLESRALPGAVAQLGERRVRNAKVEGSIPFRSTSQAHGPEQTPYGNGDPSDRRRTWSGAFCSSDWKSTRFDGIRMNR
jgi:hypothetical protein